MGRPSMWRRLFRCWERPTTRQALAHAGAVGWLFLTALPTELEVTLLEAAQVWSLQTKLDLIKMQVQGVEEARQLLEGHLWSGLERVSPIVMSGSSGKELEPPSLL